jgi:hypothetical protein
MHRQSNMGWRRRERCLFGCRCTPGDRSFRVHQSAVRIPTNIRNPAFVRWFGSGVTHGRAITCFVCAVTNGVLLATPIGTDVQSAGKWASDFILVLIAIFLFGRMSTLCLYLVARFLAIFFQDSAREWATNGLMILGELILVYGKVAGLWWR